MIAVVSSEKPDDAHRVWQVRRPKASASIVLVEIIFATSLITLRRLFAGSVKTSQRTATNRAEGICEIRSQRRARHRFPGKIRL
jgi:hypothetical protein